MNKKKYINKFKNIQVQVPELDNDRHLNSLINLSPVHPDINASVLCLGSTR